MPTGPRFVLEHVCYHIITRGNQKQQIFLEPGDFSEFIRRLRRYKRKYGFSLYGYCLMTNHLHIIGEPKDSQGLAKFMQGLLRSYTSYFNKKYRKTGHLWEGRFKSKIVVKDSYLVDCIHYIELNPVRANMVKTAGEYLWSSHKERMFSKGDNGKLLDELHI